MVDSFGQISGIYGSNVDLYDLIKQQEEISIGGGYKMNLVRITDIEVEQYPVVDLTAKLLELAALRSAAIEEGEDPSEIEEQIEECENLQRALNGPSSAIIKLSVNGSEILVAQNKVYHLHENINSLSLAQSSVPIVVNYTCKLNQIEDTSAGVIESIDASRIWGQVSGIFTTTNEVLEFYHYNYRNSETFRIYSNNGPEKLLVKDSRGNIIVDNSTYNVYKSVNIFDIIREETQKQVEAIYNTKFELDENGQLTDGKIYYTFNDIILFDIEADEGTMLELSQNADGSNAITVRIGPTCRYTLNPLDSMIKYIQLKEPQYCVINYKCLTNQMRMRG